MKVNHLRPPSSTTVNYHLDATSTSKTINDNDSHNIILSYLVHGCFKDTVESLVTSTGLKVSAAQLEDMEKRKRILHSALEGNALEAIALTEQVSPDILENNKDLLFDLLSLHFVELICSRKCTEALEFAQAKLTPFGKVQKYVEKLEDFMALLAYEEPEKSPMFHLLSFEYRQATACYRQLEQSNSGTCKPAKLFSTRKANTAGNCS